MPASVQWNELIPPRNRLDTDNKNHRPSKVQVPTHIVIHVTGTTNLSSVKRTFQAANSVSAHYLVDPTGELFQFVADGFRAWHAGIDSPSRKLYRSGASVWQKYLKYFSWYKGYPRDAAFVDSDVRPVWDSTEAAFVKRHDGKLWQEYDYFRERWPEAEIPVNFAIDSDPNNYSIGIEILGFGSRTPDPTVYTDATYTALDLLVGDLSGKYSIPRTKGRIVGHEDVHPIGRFGWDPSQGFDWSVLHTDD